MVASPKILIVIVFANLYLSLNWANARILFPREKHRFTLDTLGKDYFKSGLKKFVALDYKSAIIDFNKAISIDPHNWKAYRFKANCENGLKRFKEAIEDYSRAISINSHDTASYKNRAEAERSNNLFELALKDYELCAKWDPTDTSLYFGRGICYYKLGQYNKAVLDCDLYIKNWPNEPFLYSRRGGAYFFLNRFNEAARDFSRHIALGGKEYGAYLLRAFCFANLSLYTPAYGDTAIMDIDKYISVEKSPDMKTAYRILGMAYSSKKDSVNARKYFEKLSNLDFEDPRSLYFWAIGEMNMNSYKKAVELLEKYETRKPKLDYEFYYVRGVARAGVQDTLGAARDYEKALQMNNSMSEVYAARIKLYFSSAKYNKVILNDLGYLLKVYNDPKRTSLLFAARSLIYFRSQKINAARSDIEHAIKLAPDEPINYLIRPVIMNDISSAIRDYDYAVNLDSKMKEAYVIRGYYYAQNDQLKRACDDLTIAEKQGAQIPAAVKDFLCEGKKLEKEALSALNFVLYPFIKEAIVNPK